MPEQKRPQGPSRFARLSGIGLQMGLTIFLFASFGKYLDQDTTGKKMVDNWFDALWCGNLFVQCIAASE